MKDPAVVGKPLDLANHAATARAREGGVRMLLSDGLLASNNIRGGLALFARSIER